MTKKLLKTILTALVLDNTDLVSVNHLQILKQKDLDIHTYFFDEHH